MKITGRNKHPVGMRLPPICEITISAESFSPKTCKLIHFF